LGPGEGVGGGVNPSPREEGKGMTPVQRPKPPQPRGLVGLPPRSSLRGHSRAGSKPPIPNHLLPKCSSHRLIHHRRPVTIPPCIRVVVSISFRK
jgi:hypothetical protein